MSRSVRSLNTMYGGSCSRGRWTDAVRAVSGTTSRSRRRGRTSNAGPSDAADFELESVRDVTPVPAPALALDRSYLISEFGRDRFRRALPEADDRQPPFGDGEESVGGHLAEHVADSGFGRIVQTTVARAPVKMPRDEVLCLGAAQYRHDFPRAEALAHGAARRSPLIVVIVHGIVHASAD